MPRVFNKKDGFPEGSVLVDRTTPFGNPFIIGKDGTRGEVISKFQKYIDNSPELVKKVKETLRGKNLVCHCFPLACHANILLSIANENQLF